MKRTLALILHACLLLAPTAWAAPTPAQPFTVAETGHGKPIILIPGLSSSAATWDDPVNRLKSRYDCHVLNLAGFAGVPAVAGEADGKMLLTVEDGLAAYIREKHLDHPILMGHSLGGFIALQFAIRYPALAGDLVIVDALPFFAQVMLHVDTAADAARSAQRMHDILMEMPAAQYRAYKQSGVATRPMVTSDKDANTLIQWSLASDRQVTSEAMYELLAADLRPQLGKITSRVLVLESANGSTPDEKAQAQALYAAQYSNLPQAKLVPAEKERHFIMLDNPAWFYTQVSSFLASPPEPAHAAAR